MKMNYFQNEYGWGPRALSEILISKRSIFHEKCDKNEKGDFQNEYGWGPRALSEIMISKMLIVQ